MTFRRNVAVIVEMADVPCNQIHFRVLVTHTLISCCILILCHMRIPGVILLCYKRISACKQKRGNWNIHWRNCTIMIMESYYLLWVSFLSIWECDKYVGFVDAVGWKRWKSVFGFCLEAALFDDFLISTSGLDVIRECMDVAGKSLFWDIFSPNVVVWAWLLLVYVSIVVGCVVIGDKILTSTFSPTR